LAFEQYVLDLNALRNSSVQRLPDPREQTVFELIYPNADMLRLRTTYEHLMAELNQRLASPLLALSFTIIGLATILAGEFNRRGMSKRILTATTAIITIQAGFMSMGGVITKHIWLAFLLYLVALVPALVSFSLLDTAAMRRDIPTRPITRVVPS
jgi:lipopolysaccharide export system permease protein